MEGQGHVGLVGLGGGGPRPPSERKNMQDHTTEPSQHHQDTLPFIFTDPKIGYRSCPVCFEKYDSTSRQPVMLPVCGHTVCRPCLSSLSSAEFLSCPCCRTGHVGISLDQLPTNYIALNPAQEPNSKLMSGPDGDSISVGLNETPLNPSAPPLVSSQQHDGPIRLPRLPTTQHPKCKIAILVIFTIILLLCFAMITIGSINIYDCPAEGYIPIWLIVTGLLLIVLVAQTAKCINDKEETSIIFGYLFTLHILFHVAWFIAGCVWVYGIHPANTAVKDRYYCDHTLYMFSYWLLNIVYIFIFIFLLCGFGYLMLSKNKHYIIFKVICPNLNKIRDPRHRILFLVILTLIMVLCFAMIIIGGINMHRCPVEPFIPVWLITSGLCLIVLAVQGAKYYTEEETAVFLGCLFGVNTVFHIAWFVTGCFWVYGVWEPNYYVLRTTEFGNVQTVNYCDYTVYMFAMWLLNLGFVAAGIVVVFIVFYCLSNWC